AFRRGASGPLERFGGEALRHRLHHLGLDAGSVVEQAPERAVRDHERAHRRGGDDGRRPRLAADERDLAEEIARSECVQLTVALLALCRPLEQDEELPPRRALAGHLLALFEIDLVREEGDFLELAPRTPRKQRNVLDQIDLLVSVQAHTVSLFGKQTNRFRVPYEDDVTDSARQKGRFL